jgi:predicted methyltransferase
VKNILLASLLLFAACGGKSPPPAAPPAPPAEEAKAEPPPAATPTEQPAPPPAPEPPAAPKPPEPPAYTPSADVPQPIRDAVTAADRDDKDRALDAGRKPAEVLGFFGIAPGQKVGELFSGGGYTTEIIARVVGDGGKVYAQNSKEILDRVREPLTARLAKPVMKNTVMVEQPADKPFPPDAKNLDAVICILNYHDLVWQKVDRAKMNKAVFAALKPGGVYAIVDHSAKQGTGLSDVQTLHRIDEDAVKKEILAAGFKLDGESDVLRNADDPRDWNASPTQAGEKRGTSDRFTLRFVKPGKAAKGKAGKK